ncbi:MAG: tyrosine--tRNA ligase [Bacteroidota bacterium]|nr:tyrosine--tRNA ligase [Bacteroidota bacterium]
MNFIEELSWRGLLHNITPGLDDQLAKEMTVGYVGFDPTGDSLHVGSLLPVMMLTHLQRAGHKPIIVIGGATGMIGDPSGKSAERNLLDEEILRQNETALKNQLSKFLDFNCGNNSALIVNNYDWTKDVSLLQFLRETGKHITISYMLAKDSVQKRIETGISFTEFSYQLLQGFDYHYLNANYNCKIQMGASDQWGNITTGTELIRRMSSNDAFAVTCPLLTKPDGSKFGKSEGGNVWLDKGKTSPYKFYQFWLNITDELASDLIRKYTCLSQEEIRNIEEQHETEPHTRLIQKALAEDVTKRVHSQEDLDLAIEASNILFGKGTAEALIKLSEEDFLAVMEGVPQYDLSKDELDIELSILDLLSQKTDVFPSKAEAKKLIQGNGLSINKDKYSDINGMINANSLINNKYVLVQKGKKNYYLITFN